jgi:hypothetical protein
MEFLPNLIINLTSCYSFQYFNMLAISAKIRPEKLCLSP